MNNTIQTYILPNNINLNGHTLGFITTQSIKRPHVMLMYPQFEQDYLNNSIVPTSSIGGEPGRGVLLRILSGGRGGMAHSSSTLPCSRQR